MAMENNLSMRQKITFRFPRVFQKYNTLELNRLVVFLKDEIEKLIFLRYIIVNLNYS